MKIKLLEDLRYKGHVKLIATDPLTGKVVAVVERSNLTVNTGLYLALDLLNPASGVTGLNYCAIGTSTTAPSAAQTTLVAEASRKVFTAVSRVTTTLTVTTFFTAAQSTYNIKEAGLFGNGATGAANSGTMFCRSLISYDNSAGLVDLTILWTITDAAG